MSTGRTDFVCKGCWVLHSACGQCSRCRESALKGAVQLQEDVRKSDSDLRECRGRLAYEERRTQKLELVIRDILLSADAMWEEKNMGHDWREAVAAARRVLTMEKT